MRRGSPGQYLGGVPSTPPPIEGATLTLTAFLGVTDGPREPDLIRSAAEYAHRWPGGTPLAGAVEDYFAAGGTHAWIAPLDALTAHSVRDAIAALDPDVALVAIPAEPVASPEIVATASDALRGTGALLLLEGPWTGSATAPAALDDVIPAVGAGGRDAAVYWPRLRRTTPEGTTVDVSPLGAVAGVIVRCEDTHGVDKAPAGATARIDGVTGPAIMIDDREMDPLNTAHVNVIRRFPGLGTVVWGARTLSSDPEWKYVPVRRMAVYLERSIRHGLQWTVFEPNDEPLWARVRESVGDFLQELFRNGMLQGPSPREAYFVRCDRSTMTQSDIDEGRVIITVGFAPVRPAEFIVVRIAAEAGAAQ